MGANKSKHPDFIADEGNNDTVTNSNESDTNNGKTGASDNLSVIASTLAQTMPKVQQHAIDLEIEQTAEKMTQYADLLDSDGNPFDASVHKTDRDGNPTLSKLGKLIKKPGRKVGGKNGESGSFIGGVGVNKLSDEQQQKIQCRASGKMAANLLITLGMVAGGEEWQPVRDEKTGLDEKLMLEGAFADYFEATGQSDIPPGMALTVAIGGYALPRFTMPKTQSRMSKMTGSIKKWWINRKLKKHGYTAVPMTKRSEPPKTSSGEFRA